MSAQPTVQLARSGRHFESEPYIVVGHFATWPSASALSGYVATSAWPAPARPRPARRALRAYYARSSAGNASPGRLGVGPSTTSAAPRRRRSVRTPSARRSARGPAAIRTSSARPRGSHRRGNSSTSIIADAYLKLIEELHLKRVPDLIQSFLNFFDPSILHPNQSVVCHLPPCVVTI